MANLFSRNYYPLSQTSDSPQVYYLASIKRPEARILSSEQGNLSMLQKMYSVLPLPKTVSRT